MKDIVHVVLLFIFLAAKTQAQDESKIIQFDGGRIQMQCSIASGLLAGIGGPATNLGGSIAYFSPEAAAVFWNPALISSVKRAALQLDYVPPVRMDLAAFADLDTEIRTSTDDAIQSYKDPALAPAYTRFDATVAQHDQIGSALIAIPWRSVSLAAYFYRPLDLWLAASFMGMHAKINSKIAVGEGKDDVYLNSFIDCSLSFQSRSNALGFAAGRQLDDQWAVGLAFERYDFALQTKGIMNVAGTMLLGGKENTFNDPNDNWHNDLNQAIEAGYAGSDWGWKAACSYQVRSDFQVSAVFSWLPNVSTTGSMQLINNAVSALNINHKDDSPGKDEILDPTKLKLSQLTLTREVPNKTYPRLEIKMPKTLALGAAYRLSWLIFHLDYRCSLSSLALLYGQDEIGLRPTHTLHLGLDFAHLQVGMGFTRLKKVAKGSENLGKPGSPFWLPLFSMGSQVRFQQHYFVNFGIVALPIPVCRISVGYAF